MSTFTQNDTDIHYEIKGSGTPLLLIGGLTTDKEIWSDMLPFLEPSFQLILPDNRGAGRSTQNQSNYSISDMADDMVGLLNHLNISKAIVVGHSMGEMILQDICIRFPQKIEKAIIAGAAAKVPHHICLHLDSTIKLNKASLDFDIILATVFPWIYAESFLLDQTKVYSEINRIKKSKYPQSLLGYINQTEAVKKYDNCDKVNKITCPTLLISGSDDILITTNTISEQLYKNIYNSKFEILHNCGHMFHREKPKQFAKLINDFSF